jgi:hypothetical protein
MFLWNLLRAASRLAHAYAQVIRAPGSWLVASS